MPVPITSESRVVKTATGAFLLNITTGRCFVVSDLGADIYAYLEEGKTVDEIKAAIQDRFSATDPQKIEADVKRFIAHLVAKNFITPPT